MQGVQNGQEGGRGSPWWILGLLCLLVVVWALHLARYLPLLPERMATHFDGAGQPNGWMTITGLARFEATVMALLLAAGLLPVWIIRATGSRFVNLPSKDYWFAPERQAATLNRLTADLLWLPCIWVAFFVALDHLVFQANLGDHPSLAGAPFAALMVAFLVITMTWTVRLLLHFRRPTERSR